MSEDAPYVSASNPDSAPLHYVAVDQSFDAEQAARDAANERLTSELHEGSRVKRLAKSIWKGSAFKEYYELKYTREAKSEIEAAGSTLYFQADESQRQRARLATIDRFLNENEEMIHTESGESREELAGESDIVSETKELIRRNVEGDLNDEALLEERTRLLDAYQEVHGDAMTGKGIVRVDNILEISAAVRGAIDHGESINSVLSNMKMSLGESRSGVRTEAHYNRAERVADKLAKTKVGSLVGPETLVTVATVAASVLRYGGHSAVGAATKMIVPGVSAGLWAGLRENKRTKDERAQHAREMAQGRAIESNSKRREEIEQSRYDTISAQELTDSLVMHFGNESELDDSREALDVALIALSKVESRIQLSDSRKMDLIAYSQAGAIEEERLALDIARAQAKTVAATRFEDPTVRQQFGMDENASLQDLINERSEVFMLAIEDDMSTKDRAFNKLKRRRVAQAAAKGAISGLLIGGFVQEGMAAVSDTRSGLIEQLWHADNKSINGTMHQTLAHGLMHGDGTSNIVEHHGPSGNYADYKIGDHGNLSLSSDQSISTNPDGTLMLRNQNGQVLVDNLSVQSDGTLTQESLNRMAASGLAVEDLSHTVELPSIREAQPASLSEYMAAHQGETTHITRDFWYDNDTPQFDKNELKLEWGGAQGTGTAVNGNYQFNVGDMTSQGSSHEGHSVAWQNAAEHGQLKLAISASADTQNQAFMVDINPDGTVNIPPGSPAAQFFGTHDGQVVFNGKYAEVVQTNGTDANGLTHVRPLATEVGNDSAKNNTFTVEKDVLQHEFRADYKATSHGYDTTTQQDTFTEMAPVIPVIPRRPLENLRTWVIPTERPLTTPRTPDQAAAYYGYNGNYELTAEQRVREFSPSVVDNPGADLELGKELNWFADELRQREGDEYINRLEETINNSAELRNIDPGIKTITTIPVAAASESDNIYGTLSVYAQQDKGALAHNIILLNVNWLDIAQNNPEKREKIDKTFAEIERARRDFPELKIATMTRQYRAETVKPTGGPIGYVASDLMNTALYALHRGIEAGKVGSDSDVAVVRQDADMKGMSRHYLSNLEKAMERHPGVDIFNGAIRSGVAMQERYPGFGIVTNFSQALRVVGSASNKPFTVGINAVARASSLAAAGGLGKISWSGAGSDDMQVGWRIGAARRGARVSQQANGYTYGADNSATGQTNRRIVAQVTGMVVDSAADRLIPKYLEGKHFGAAWDDRTSNGTSFTSGPGGYRDRDADAKILADNPREPITDGKIFDFIETNITEELRDADEPTSRKVLGVFFGGAPGAYRATELGTKHASFTLTSVGRTFIKNRIQRETNGRFGSYGLRKMRQQYGVSGKRQSAHAESPLVPALT